MNIPIIDSHLHLWDNHYLSYPWLKEHACLDKPHVLADFHAINQIVPIAACVFVQAECAANQSLAEVEWVTKLAKQENKIRGIVAQAPLENVVTRNAFLKTLQQNTLVKSIRRLLQCEDNLFCLQPDFINGVKLLADYQFSFDICIFARQLPTITSLVEQCPEVNFILDHAGKPDLKQKDLTTWQHDLKKLAAYPNVWCKISGLVTEAHHQTWQSTDLHPAILHVIDTFGVDRIMFGSDWPVINLASQYQQWIELLFNLLKHWSEQDLTKLFFTNTQRCYQLGDISCA